MTDDAVGATRILDHRDRDLARISTRRLEIDILSSDFDIGLVEIDDRLHRTNIDRRNAENHFYLVPRAIVIVAELLSECDGFWDGLIHLPVACHHVLTHISPLLQSFNTRKKLALYQFHRSAAARRDDHVVTLAGKAFGRTYSPPQRYRRRR